MLHMQAGNFIYHKLLLLLGLQGVSADVSSCGLSQASLSPEQLCFTGLLLQAKREADQNALSWALSEPAAPSSLFFRVQ